MARRNSRFIQSAIKRPGALSKQKRRGESTAQAARRIKNSPNASSRSKSQANFYLNVLAPTNSKRSSGGSSSGGKQKRRSHTVKSHKRTLSSGRTVRVKRHRRSKSRKT